MLIVYYHFTPIVPVHHEGGGYIGVGVYTMRSKADIWWTRDGITWNEANSIDANLAAFKSGKSW